MWAAKNGTLVMVEALVSRGAVVDAVDKDGRAATTWAEEAGRTDILGLLRQHKR